MISLNNMNNTGQQEPSKLQANQQQNSAGFEKVFKEKMNFVLPGSVMAAEEAYRQEKTKRRKVKGIVEKNSDDENESPYKIVKELKKKLKSLIELEQRTLGL